MIPLAVPDVSGNERRYLNECIDTTFISSVGPFVDRFEQDLGRVSGSGRSAVAVTSGTCGLHLALLATGVQPGDLVIVPDFTFIASANAVAHCGAVPWLLDIDQSSWTISVDELARELEGNTIRQGDKLVHRESGRRVAAILPVYTLGHPADMDPIRELAKAYSMPLVADAAAALGAKYQDRHLAKLADLTVFSFNGNKTVTCGGGGAIIGENLEQMKWLKHVSTTARPGEEYIHDQVGYNYRMTNIQAAIGVAQLERLDNLVEKKRWIARVYKEAFSDFEGVTHFPEADWAKSACWLSGIRLNSRIFEDLKAIIEKLKVAGIQARKFWQPIHVQPPFANAPKGRVVNSQLLSAELLTLPCSTGLSPAEIEMVIDRTRRVLREFGQ